VGQSLPNFCKFSANFLKLIYLKLISSSQVYNSLAIYGAIIRPPWFDPGRPPAMNFGAIGTFMGHEVTHGFDSIGWHFDGQGNLKDPAAQTDDAIVLERMERRMACFVDQYGGYEVNWRRISQENANATTVRGNALGPRPGSRWPRTLPTTAPSEHHSTPGWPTRPSIRSRLAKKTGSLSQRWRGSATNNSSSLPAHLWVPFWVKQKIIFSPFW
jgi:hypothetical protein